MARTVLHAIEKTQRKAGIFRGQGVELGKAAVGLEIEIDCSSIAADKELKVGIEISRDAGKSWRMLASAVMNGGEFTRRDGTKSTTRLLKIEDSFLATDRVRPVADLRSDMTPAFIVHLIS